MGQCYLLGGDTWHRVTWTDRLCQSFRPQSNFVLQFVDIIEKHNWWDDPPIVELYNADIYGHPRGDRISKGAFLEVPCSFTSPLWVFTESWGKTLTENHLWRPGPPGQTPEVTIKNGIVTLVNPGYTSSHIDTLPDTTFIPLVSDYGNRLFVHHHAPLATGHPQTHWISYAFETKKDLIETWLLEAVISHGTNWPPIETCGITPLGSSFEEGKGPHVFDLTEWWKFCRACHGLPNDPTGWKLSRIMLLVEDTEATPGTTLSNSYLSIARRKFEPPPYDDYPIQFYPALEDEIKHRAHYQMIPVQLYSGGHYTLVIRHKNIWPPMPADIFYDKGDATYPRGLKAHSDDRGETWTDDDDDDVCFAAYGTPPTPVAPPVAPAGNIAFLDIKQTLTAFGYEIVVITDVPCHLYMMWTNHEPNKHKIVGLRRGDLALRETRYCFVNWHKNEQEEAGDTLTHTFIKEPWPVCETRWFTFRAEVQSLWSASAGPIFKKHRPGSPATAYFYPDAHPEVTSCDGQARRAIRHRSWADIHDEDGTGGGAFGSTEMCRILAANVPDLWSQLYRTFFLFDTSSIPPGTEILSAELEIYITETRKITGSSPSWTVVKSWPASNTDIVAADYQRIGSTPLTNIIPHADLDPPSYNTFTFTEAGLAAIIPGGITKLGIREYTYDCRNIEPPWAYIEQCMVRIRMAEDLSRTPPRLKVTYLSPEEEVEMKLIILNSEIVIASHLPTNAEIPWTDIDLTAYISPITKFAFVRGQAQRNQEGVCDDINLYIRPKGGAQSVMLTKWWCQKTPAFLCTNDTFVPIGEYNKIQYRLSWPVGAAEVYVMIWLLGYGEQA